MNNETIIMVEFFNNLFESIDSINEEMQHISSFVNKKMNNENLDEQLAKFNELKELRQDVFRTEVEALQAICDSKLETQKQFETAESERVSKEAYEELEKLRAHDSEDKYRPLVYAK